MIGTIVISENNSTIEILRRYIDEFDSNCHSELVSESDSKEFKKFNFLAGTSDFSKAYDAVKELSKALLIVDISNYQEQALNFVSKITSDFQYCTVVTVSDKPDIDIVVRTMRVGADDFISMPFIKEVFISKLDKLYAQITGEKPKKSKCRIISVYSNKGGVGKTSIASNLALELAKITKENVALVDLNFQFGDVTTFLDLQPSFNISHMLQNLDKLNEDFLLSTMERYKETSLYVLADPPYFSHEDKIPHQEISRLFEILRETFSYVVVDTSGGFNKQSMSALENSDLIFLVTINNLPALRNCQRCLELFEKTGLNKDKIQLLINRYMENDEIGADEAEKVLGKSLYWKIPNNYFTMMSAINKGEPASKVNPDSNVALSYKNLALKVSDNMYR